MSEMSVTGRAGLTPRSPRVLTLVPDSYMGASPSPTPHLGRVILLRALMTAMLVSATTAAAALVVVPSAQADHGDYPPFHIETTAAASAVDSTITTRQRPRSRFRIAENSNRVPRANVTIRFVSRGTGEVVRTAERFYGGGTVVYTFAPLPRGSYTVRFRAEVINPRFEDARDSHFLRVTRP